MGDRVLVPMASTDPMNVDPPDFNNPEVMKVEEKKADDAMILEQLHEKEIFKQLMGM